MSIVMISCNSRQIIVVRKVVMDHEFWPSSNNLWHCTLRWVCPLYATKKTKPNQLTKQFTVKNGNFWTVYAKLLTMYKSILFTWNGFKHCDSQIKFFFSNVTLIARNIVILKQYINEIAICQKSHRSQFWIDLPIHIFPWVCCFRIPKVRIPHRLGGREVTDSRGDINGFWRGPLW